MEKGKQNNSIKLVNPKQIYIITKINCLQNTQESRYSLIQIDTMYPQLINH